MKTPVNENGEVKSRTPTMPAALWALTISAFAIGTTEMVIVGLLPTVAADLAVSIPSAGLLVTVYALGVAVGAPVLTALTNKIARKPLFIYLMLLFVAANLSAGLAPGYISLMLARIISGFAHGVFFSTGATVAAAIVPPNKRASAIAIMFAGLTVSLAVGVPLGTFTGQHLGWRATFLGVAGLGIIGLTANSILLPENIPNEVFAPVKKQFSVLVNKRLVIAFLTTIFNYGGVFLVFTYLSPLLMEITGLSPNAVNLVLLIFGVAIATGNLIGGRLANQAPLKALLLMLVLQAVTLLLFTCTVNYTLPAIITLFAIGALMFATVPASQLYVVQTAEQFNPGLSNVASSFNIASFNAGIALGAWLGGWVVSSALGLKSTPWSGAVLMVIAIGLVFVSFWINKKNSIKQ